MNLYESIRGNLKESKENLKEETSTYTIFTEQGEPLTIIPSEEKIVGFKCKYVDGIEVGMSFGLRMLRNHNVNVYGRVIEVLPNMIKVQHPNHDSIYEVPTNNVEVNGKEIRFFPKEDSYTWFGFIDLEKGYYDLKDLNEAETFTFPKEVVDKVQAEYDSNKPEIKKELEEELRELVRMLKPYFSIDEIMKMKEIKAYSDAIKDPEDIWCECSGDTGSKFKPDGEPYLGVTKHAYICNKCGKYTQIG